MLPSNSEGPEHAAERALTAETLRTAINRLTEEQAQVVTLRFLEGLSITEVAESMGKTEGAIKAMQYRAVTSLRRLLEYQA
jgi:RNA polymerase sigma-70 factor (ECF subfamily)